MSDQINAITVVLEKDIRDEDVELLLNAIKCMKGVLGADVNVVDYVTHVAIHRVREDLGKKLLKIVYPDSPLFKDA